jgi:Ca2+-binding RTX toxin-like protein
MPTTAFKTGLNGWTVTNGTETFDASDGTPAGSLRGVEGGSGVWYFSASPQYLGDMSAYYGGELSFNLRQDVDTNQFIDEPDVILTGGGLTLVMDFGADWTHYSVSMALGAGWRVNSLSGRIATETEIRTVLESLDSLLIRGEFVVGTAGDAANLDKVSLVVTPPAPPVFHGTTITSDFKDGVDGWSFTGDVKEFRTIDSGGNPDGFLEIVDYASGPTCYFVAADKFLGDKLAFHGGTLSFDLRQSSLSSQFNDTDVVITGGGLSLVLDTAYNPGLDWTNYQVTLDTTSDWRISTLTGDVATDDQIRQVLADISDLWIRAEYVVGNDTDGLDNVILKAADANVRLLADATTGTLLSSHDTLQQALSGASIGNAILIENAAGAASANYEVKTNGLTIISDAALTSTLTLKGASSITLAGASDLAITGNTKDNAIVGSDGDNLIHGLKGDDTLHGGAGRDSLFGDAGVDSLSGGDGYDLLNGGGAGDMLDGGKGNDKLFGKSGNDMLLGQIGHDKLSGLAGRDTLDGGTGNDTLIGGSGSDVFLFGVGFGTDTITDFNANDDSEVIDLSQITAITDFTDLSDNHMDTVPGGVLIDDLAGNTIFLKGVILADLDAADFNF